MPDARNRGYGHPASSIRATAGADATPRRKSENHATTISTTTLHHSTGARRTYVNPVATVEFPDPFILKHLGEYWAYCTGIWHDGRAFGIMHSRDLVNWQRRAGAM